MPNAEFRRAMHEVADLAADYLAHVGQYPVLPRIQPGDVRRQLPAAPPEEGEGVDALLADYRRLIEPNVTHWNHPGFMAYFAISGSAPGILAESLTAALNVNAMLWRSGPAPTELEQVVCDWLRQLMDLPPAFSGHINDTASSSSMLALATARHRATGGAVRESGLAGLPPLTVYASEHAHSSIDKAMITLGLGLAQLRHVPVDGEFRMRPDALAAMIAADRAAGMRPIAVVATAGTTSTTAVDPIAEVLAVARREKLWLHVDAAYAGSAAICPEYRALMHGWEDADSIVVNPHKWLFTPVDCSVLLLRRPEELRAAFAHTADYLQTTEQGVINLMDYGPQLGRRFRSLKLWFVIRAFGAEGLRERIRAHCALAQEFAEWVGREPGWEVVAPVPFSTVCFRAEGSDALNDRILAAVNAEGSTFLSGTKLTGRAVLRLTVGNIRTTREHVARAWEVLRRQSWSSNLSGVKS
jgi:aromatic-L-amino-acid/L-tryptophan decarboxylase